MSDLNQIHTDFQAWLPAYAPACYWEPRLSRFCYETSDRPIPDELAQAAIECGAREALASLGAFVVDTTSHTRIWISPGPSELMDGPTRLARLHAACKAVYDAGGFKP